MTQSNPAKSWKTTADFKRIQQLKPVNLDVIAEGLAPVIGGWPATYEGLDRTLYRAVGKQVKREGIDTCEPGRQLRVHAIARSKGKVQVLEVPAYIHADLIHALPAPESYTWLGDAVHRRAVAESDAPPPGYAWFVVVKVPGLGRRLRLWDWTDWPEPAEMTDADWGAFVAWWNLGVQTGWATFSTLADDDGEPAMIVEKAPGDVRARLLPTPGLTARTASRSESAQEEPTQGSHPEPAPITGDGPPLFNFGIVDAQPNQVGVRHDARGRSIPIFDGWSMKLANGAEVVPHFVGTCGIDRISDGWDVKLPDGRVGVVGCSEEERQRMRRAADWKRDRRSA